MFIYKIEVNNNILNQAVQKEDVYLPDFFPKQLGNHLGKFVFSHPKDIFLNEINPETLNVFNPKDIFKIPQENLVKTAIENYILCISEN